MWYFYANSTPYKSLRLKKKQAIYVYNHYLMIKLYVIITQTLSFRSVALKQQYSAISDGQWPVHGARRFLLRILPLYAHYARETVLGSI